MLKNTHTGVIEGRVYSKPQIFRAMSLFADLHKNEVQSGTKFVNCAGEREKEGVKSFLLYCYGSRNTHFSCVEYVMVS